VVKVLQPGQAFHVRREHLDPSVLVSVERALDRRGLNRGSSGVDDTDHFQRAGCGHVFLLRSPQDSHLATLPFSRRYPHLTRLITAEPADGWKDITDISSQSP
jgi:hypothetical protein